MVCYVYSYITSMIKCQQHFDITQRHDYSLYPATCNVTKLCFFKCLAEKVRKINRLAKGLLLIWMILV